VGSSMRQRRAGLARPMNVVMYFLRTLFATEFCAITNGSWVKVLC
jgi:hypothetical protein